MNPGYERLPACAAGLETELQNRVREQTRCILAVLILASEWHQRFPGGWVVPDSFEKHGNHVGGTDPESRARALRRAWKQLEDCGLPLALESEPGRSGLVRRRLHSVPRPVADWLYEYGSSQIIRESWVQFLNDQTRRVEPYERFVLAFDEIMAGALSARGQIDTALELVERRLAVVGNSPRRRIRLLFLKARLLAMPRRTRERSQLADRILQELISELRAPSSVADRLLLSRVRIARAYTAFDLRSGALQVSAMRGNVLAEILAEARAAEAFASLHGPLERAQLLYIRGRAAFHELKASSPEDPGRTATFREGNMCFGRAMALFEQIGDYGLLAEIMVRLGELRFEFHGLEQIVLPAQRAAVLVTDALRWFEAGERLLGEVSTAPPFFRTFARLRIAECCSLQILCMHSVASHDELMALLRKARAHFATIPMDSDWHHVRAEALNRLDEIVRTTGLT